MRPVPGDQRRRRPAADERPAPPALGVLDRLEQEGPIVGVVAGQAGEGGDRAWSGRPAAPARPAPPCTAGPGRRTRPGWAGSRAVIGGAGRLPAGARRAGRSSCARRCGRRRRPPARPRRAGRRRRSRSRRPGPTGGRRRCRPCASAPAGCGTRRRCGPSRASRPGCRAFIQPIISTAPLAVLLHDGGNQPVGVVVDPSQLFGAGVDGGGDRHAHMVGARARQSGSMATAAPA